MMTCACDKGRPCADTPIPGGEFCEYCTLVCQGSLKPEQFFSRKGFTDE